MEPSNVTPALRKEGTATPLRGHPFGTTVSGVTKDVPLGAKRAKLDPVESRPLGTDRREGSPESPLAISDLDLDPFGPVESFGEQQNGDHCFICLADTPPLVATCAPNTCHNLKAHVACLRGISKNCTICKQPYPFFTQPPRSTLPFPTACFAPLETVVRRAAPASPQSFTMLLVGAWSCIVIATFGSFVAMIVYVQQIPPGVLATLCCCMFAVTMVAYIQIRATLLYAGITGSHSIET